MIIITEIFRFQSSINIQCSKNSLNIYIFMATLIYYIVAVSLNEFDSRRNDRPKLNIWHVFYMYKT